jgi:replicative DNA helicase
VLDEDAFHADYHKKIYQAMLAMFDRSEPVDTITLAEELRRRGELDMVGGEAYLVELTMKVTSGANVEYHAKIVLEKSLMRNLISAASGIAARAFNPTEDAFDLLDEAEQSVFKISEKRLKKSFISMHKAVHDTIELLESIHGKHGGVTGVPTGFRELDTLTGGWQNSDLIIIAGRPSCGKTAFALSLARNAALHKERATPVGIFSLEMSIQQLVMRLLCAEAKVDAHAVRTGRLPEDDWKRLSIAAGRVTNANIFIDDSASLGILELRAKARRLKAERNIGLVIVDYLQLMQGPRNAESREKEISAISRSLKALAKELNIPVIALSQLSRAVESRTDKRPILSDLRESGAIEQDADVVAFVHRPEMYEDPNTDEGRESQGMADIIVGKQRNGPTDDVHLAFVNRYARFENLAPPTFDVVPAGPEEEPPF